MEVSVLESTLNYFVIFLPSLPLDSFLILLLDRFSSIPALNDLKTVRKGGRHGNFLEVRKLAMGMKGGWEKGDGGDMCHFFRVEKGVRSLIPTFAWQVNIS